MSIATVRLSDLRDRIEGKTVSIKNPFPEVQGNLEGRIQKVGYSKVVLRKKDGTIVELDIDLVKQLWVLEHIKVMDTARKTRKSS